jgi:hypothetical protein
MDILETATTDELIDALCERSAAIAVALVAVVNDTEVTFRLHGDLMTRSGLVQTIQAAQQANIIEWMGGEQKSCTVP